ncbi:hypothetical protein [Amycolatopsis sp. NPDC004079]|uniref:hypothetical protein n=1 Tax=Amycolatopsis sp. NPDC004079 TaxID=3154549 RepID=UPI0033B8F7FE
MRRRAGGHQVNLDDVVNAVVRPEVVPSSGDELPAATPVAADPYRPVPAGCVALTDPAQSLPDIRDRDRDRVICGERSHGPGRSGAARPTVPHCGALPTPDRSVLRNGLSPGAWGAPGDTRRARHYFRRKYRRSTARGPVQSGRPADIAGPLDWGDYAAAVHRWELVTGRCAPHPTPPGRYGLAPIFVEWLMGLPAGWVTADHLGLPRTAQLRALGNGVIPAQAAYALRLLLGDLASLHRHPFRPTASATPRHPGPARGSLPRPGGPTRPPSAARASTAAEQRRRSRPLSRRRARRPAD